MAPPFTRLSVSDFGALLREYPWKRRVTEAHVYHTWRPRRQDYVGEKTISSMYELHTTANGWSDIAQHISIAPDGMIWTGRNWNQPPASAKGFNGDNHTGPFVFVMIGNFDKGHDPFDGPQRETALTAVALLLDHFDLAPEAVRFHHEMSPNSCPATSIDRHEFLMAVEELRGKLKDQANAPSARVAPSFPAEQYSIDRARAVLSAPLPAQNDPADAELLEADMQQPDQSQPETLRAPTAEIRAPGLNTERLAALRPHVVNSNGGVFSDSGLFQTSPGDVDAIFQQHLPRALEARGDQPLHILFYAHGGLVGEEAGLQIAADQVDWWLANGIYPIEFVWETGLLETISQLLSPARDLTLAGRRDIFDHTTDRALEELAHRLGGPQIWSGMKFSAMRGVQPGGATLYVIQKLRAFCEQYKDARIELHAVGHSAGSIFHSYFLPSAAEALSALDRKLTSLHLLAPAITVDDFHQRLIGLLGDKVKNTTIFTMAKDWERADNTGFVYRKSLLYLIYYALERSRETPILGLEVSLRDDPALRAVFGLDASGSTVGGEVVFSKTAATTGPRASTSTSHGGFDNDAPTMEAVLRRIINRPTGVLAANFPDAARGSRSFPTALGLSVLSPELRDRLQDADISIKPPPIAAGPVSLAYSTVPAKTAATSDDSGQRRALCIGINAYPANNQLAGCVADATAWANMLTVLGFQQPIMLTDGRATRSAILDALTALLQTSRAGDTVVVHYSGHGTQVDDLDGDEDDSFDEAICPVDFMTGAFIIDDDFAEVFAQIPDGVNVTCFFDCCHSGTNTRLAVGGPGSRPSTARARFMVATPQMQQAHRQFRAPLGHRGLDPRRQPDLMKQVVFAACQDREVAYEQNQQGDFTRICLPILRRGTVLTNEQLQAAVIAAFGPQARQHPLLDCATAARAARLFGPVAGDATTSDGRAIAIGAAPGTAQLLEAVAALLRGGS